MFERAHDRLALVPRRHDDGHRWPVAFGPVALGRLEREFLVSRDQEREDHEPDDEAGDIGEEERNHPGHDGADRGLEFASPWLGDPDAERDPRERQSECDRESNRWPKPDGRGLAPCKAAELSERWTNGVAVAVGDSDLVIDRGRLRRRGSS